MEIKYLIKLLLPVLTIMAGIYLKLSNQGSESFIKKYWWLFIVLGLFQLVHRMVKYL